MNKQWTSLSRFCCDRSGTIAVMTALSLTALVGFAGLGIETTQWYTEKRAIQAAADDAALSAAVAYSQGNTSGYTTEGKSVAGTDGFVDGTNSVSVTVNKPPASGPYASNASAIQVIINAPAQPVLSKMFIGDFTITASSVAIPASSSTNGCVLALNGAAAGAGTLSGTTNITLKNCSFDVNSKSGSALVMNGNSSLTAADVYVVGGDSISNNSTLTVTGSIKLNQGAVTDPYATRVIPTPATPCVNLGQIKTTVTLNPGTYCDMNINAGAVVTLNPGIYILDSGDFNIAGGGTITGNGVTIILTTSGTDFSKVGNIIINGGATVNLIAPDATTNFVSKGMVFWQDTRKPDSGKDNFNGGSTMNITGAIYLPSQTVDFNGGNTAGGTGCTQIVASIIVFTGNSEFDNNCTGSGIANIQPPSQLATLAQ
jgi:Flp pilus assembly protein TadG